MLYKVKLGLFVGTFMDISEEFNVDKIGFSKVQENGLQKKICKTQSCKYFWDFNAVYIKSNKHLISGTL